MKNEIFEMLKIYEQDFPEQLSKVTKTEVIAHYYGTLNKVNDKGMNDKSNAYNGKLWLKHSAPYPTCALGNTAYPGSCLAPLIK